MLSGKSNNLILINPYNPSGHFNRREDLIELIDYMKKSNKLLIDESFVDFANGGEKETLIEQNLIDKYDNLIIIKSISKSYRVPGIRLSVVISSNTDLLKKIRIEICIWNVNSFGEYFLQIIGKYQKDYLMACELIRKERSRFIKNLQQISFFRGIPIWSKLFFM